MTISDIDRSLFKFLYDTFEVPKGIKIFDNVHYVDFTTFDKWIVVDTLSNSTGSVPRANYYLHISLKNGLRNEKLVLNRFVDEVCAQLNPMRRLNVYDDLTGTLKGEMEVCETSLTPILQHSGGGSFRSLAVGFVYAGEIPLV